MRILMKLALFLQQYRHGYVFVFALSYPFILISNGVRIVFHFPYDEHEFALMIAQLILLGILHIWCYALPKALSGIQVINGLLVAESNSSTEVRDLVEANKSWSNPFSLKDASGFGRFIKLLYPLLWIVEAVFVGYGLYYFEFIPISRWSGRLTFFLLIIVFIVGEPSYYLSVWLTYILHKISHIKKISYDREKPSSTTLFRVLQKDESNVSIAFLIISILCVAAYITVAIVAAHNQYLLARVQQHRLLLALLSIAILIPTMLSYFVLLVAPKLFLDRLLSHWKDDIISTSSARKTLLLSKETLSPAEEKELNAINERIDKVMAERIQIPRREVLISIIAIVTDISTIVINVLLVTDRL